MCPDDDLIDRFIAGDATAEESAGVRAHLSTCATCRRLVSELIKDSVTSRPVQAADAGDGPFLRGTQVARYLIVDVIGAGAMGMVYSAYDPKLDRKVALKLLRPEAPAEAQPLLRERMLREAQAMARLVHPNVVGIHDVGELGERVHIAMELVDGHNVRAWLAERPRRWREVLGVFVQAGRGLAAAHGVGLVHRDFKPDNILLASDGRVLVSDFGMAYLGAGERDTAEMRPADDPEMPGALGVRPELTQMGAVLGTPSYMAPEQLAGGRVDARADIFAFGVSAWEALHGQHPFREEGQTLDGLRMAVLAGRVREPARSPVPRRVRRLLRAALQAEPERRPASLTELLDALAFDPRRRILSAALATAIFAALIGVGAMIREGVASRSQAARAREQAAVARGVGQEAKEMELGLRAERLLPLHDVEPAEGRIRRRLARIRAALRGDRGDAPLHDALGRGLAALGDHAAARVELEAALRHGPGDPDLHFTLGLALVRVHEQAIADARGMGGPSWLEQRKATLDAELLPAIREHLALSSGTTLASPRLLEALLAFQAGDLPAAVVASREAASQAPLFYEAQLLGGAILQSQS